MAFQKEDGDWTRFRMRFGLQRDDEVDLHFGRRDRWAASYDDVMAEVAEIVEKSVQEAHAKGRPYIMFTHGRSTSRNGQTTARSVVRGFMRSSAATPYIERSECVQHSSVFVAKIKPRRDGKLSTRCQKV